MNRKRVACPACGNYTRIASWRTHEKLHSIGYYCQYCKTFYPKKGTRIGQDKLYQGLKQVT